MKIGIIREGKVPADKRTPLTPQHCIALMERFPEVQIVAQTSAIRCFADAEYAALGIAVVDDITDCDVILGIKEVPKELLVPDSTMMFFSHTIKKQPHNRKLLQEIIRKNIRLIDYECLTDNIGRRILGFGKYAGIVGAYNALIAFGKRNGSFDLKPAHQCSGIAEMHSELKKVRLGNERIIVSGGGKVAHGVRETLTAAGIAEVSVPDFLTKEFAHPIWCNADILDYHELNGNPPESVEAFIRDSAAYTNTFTKFLSKADIYISAHFWDGRSAPFFTQEDVKADDFRPRVIADITCDIQGSVPTTLRSSTIESQHLWLRPTSPPPKPTHTPRIASPSWQLTICPARSQPMHRLVFGFSAELGKIITALYWKMMFRKCWNAPPLRKMESSQNTLGTWRDYVAD
jgi:saccharopine dehydrogenase (NAD+, L-lysine-forming)